MQLSDAYLKLYCSFSYDNITMHKLYQLIGPLMCAFVCEFGQVFFEPKQVALYVVIDKLS